MAFLRVSRLPPDPTGWAGHEPIVRDTLVTLGHLALDVGRALHRIDDAAKFDQRTVAHKLDHTAVMPSDPWIDQLAATRP